MSRHTTRVHAGNDRASLYTEITDKIIAELEAGRIPWVQPWGTAAIKAPLAMPRNAATQRGYSGINVLILWGAVIEGGFSGKGWLTFRQALGLGGHVRKGERGTVLSFAILAEYFPKELAGRANGALNLFHIATAFAVQYATGVVLQHWTPQAGHYPEIAYQTAFALNLAFQVAAWIWFIFPRVRTYSRQGSSQSRGRISNPEGVAANSLIKSDATMYI